MRVWLLFSTLLLCLTAYAHTPVCRCMLADNQVICEGRFDDGSKAVGTSMLVISYQEQEIAHGELDKDSRFRFPLPDQAFYLLMDAGPGEMVEVDWEDIRGLARDHFPDSKKIEKPWPESATHPQSYQQQNNPRVLAYQQAFDSKTMSPQILRLFRNASCLLITLLKTGSK